MNYLITNANIVNERIIFKGSILIENGIITEITKGTSPLQALNSKLYYLIDAKGKYLFPGIIDTHVHFRDPGLTHKGDIYTESKAAIAGGVTSYFDMPNTIPNTITDEILEEKYAIASEKSLANYSFYIGATNNNLDELLKLNPDEVCGIKVFMGASTGNMMVDSRDTINRIFSEAKLPISVHCEDEEIIKNNLELYKTKYSDNIPAKAHSLIRSEEACYKSSLFTTELAKKCNTKLNVLHVSTGKETDLFNKGADISKKRITSETCVHYLFFDEKDYESFGMLIKCNPSIKSSSDRIKLLEAINNDKINIISSDHAPHSIEDKISNYLNAPSGIPTIQHTFPAMLDFYHGGLISLEKIAEKMCHNPAACFNIDRRGFIRKGYYADITIADLDSPWRVDKSNILYKCKWSPFEGHTFKSQITHTFVNGHLVYNNGAFDENTKGKRIRFKR